MLLTTTPSIEGRTITDYKAIVTGEVIIGANIFKDMFAGIRDIIGGRASSYETVMREAKDQAMAEMIDRARRYSADAIVGIDLDFQTVGRNGSMMMVSASGTAVTLS
jgi:uncharacterized protein YbjQ (UPF0145 family)